MADPIFFTPAASLSLDDLIALTGAHAANRVPVTVRGIASLEEAGGDDLAYMDNPKYVGALEQTRAGACLVSSRFEPLVPPTTLALVVPQPYRAFGEVGAYLFPDAMRPASAFGQQGISPQAHVHPSATLGEGVTIDPGAVIGPYAQIGEGTLVAANAVIGAYVQLGRDVSVAFNASVCHAIVGNRVIIHSGARIGQDGFGFAMSSEGHRKMPQLGRVVLHDDVEIGANTTIDRGANRDTVIGQGTKIDNLVQIGHNVVMGRHCIIVSQVGVSGSVTIEDFVVLGGQVGTVGHIRIGQGAQIAGAASITHDVPPGQKWGGYPARPLRQWAQEIAFLTRLTNARKRGNP